MLKFKGIQAYILERKFTPLLIAIRPPFLLALHFLNCRTSVSRSGSLLLQTEAALVGDYGREQIDYRYVLYMTPLQKTRTIPLKTCIIIIMANTYRRMINHMNALRQGCPPQGVK